MTQRLIYSLAAILFYLSANSQTTNLWGLTSAGGTGWLNFGGVGTVFKTDNNGNNHEVVDYFIDTEGSNPQYTSVTQAANGKIYGIAQGGLDIYGLLYEFDPITNAHRTVFRFNTTTGVVPNGNLLLASNGSIYGVCLYGGAFGFGGTIFEYIPTTDAVTIVHNFGANVLLGNTPFGGLIQATNGKLYGTTLKGGTYGAGTLFEFDLQTNTCTKLYDLDTNATGYEPRAQLCQASNGKLYGTTSLGGFSSKGTLFEYDITLGTLAVKHNFTQSTGGEPYGHLLEATTNKMYGLASSGGGFSARGVVYEYDLVTNIYTVKVTFTTGSTSPRYPYGGFIKATNGKLYALSKTGGVNDLGTFFEYDNLTNLLTVKQYLGGHGSEPFSSFFQAANGLLYGVCSSGGASYGTLFTYDTVLDTTITRMVFNNGNKGQAPKGSLTQGFDGMLYGITYQGGGSSKGTIFKVHPSTGVFTKLTDCTFSNGAGNTYGSLTQALNGNFYGMSSDQGLYGGIFEFNPITNVITQKFSFDYLLHGDMPYGDFLLAPNGKLYALTSFNGALGGGTLIEYDYVTNTVVKKKDFGGMDGYGPRGSLMLATNGKMYGMTRYGGAFGAGVIFEYDYITNIFTKLYDFQLSTTGGNPFGSLVQVPSTGRFYGMLSEGPTSQNKLGSIFQYIPATNSFTVIATFDDSLTLGSEPYGTLLHASNGLLYGMTPTGGAFRGTIFEINPVSYAFRTTHQFLNDVNGNYPVYGKLIEVTNCAVTQMVQTGASFYAMATNATYQWINCATQQQIAGATNQSFTPAANGSYAVIVTQNGCTDTSQCLSITNVGIFENDLSHLSFSLSPNPSNGSFTINTAVALDNVWAEAYNSMGEKVMSVFFEKLLNESINQNFSSGIYTLVIKNKNGSKAVSKFTVIK
ncbi:MAG TPA: T9SS type A sorting domain-containing protein [Bacteroidia bacterium]|nr:T9SS type A sorting domain-containing protein [Bacteroidia bacterium]HNU34909.1 T9SS type A sorting domain-containing protein [Bacteroidia bacterium]